jgi:SAM-dependent methyltransferase
MHPQAYDYVRDHARPSPGLRVLDIGGQDMNGSVRPLFARWDAVADHDPVVERAAYLSLDIAAGTGVDIVADAATWRLPPDMVPFDVVVCCEVFEHTSAWRDIANTAYLALRPGGRFIATMAGPGRPEHSGRRASLEMDDDEWYENIDPARLEEALVEIGFADVAVDVAGEDVRATARRPQGVHVLTAIYGGYDGRVLPIRQQLRSPGQLDPATTTYTLLAETGSPWQGEVMAGLDVDGNVWPFLQNDLRLDVEPDTRQAARFPKFLPHMFPIDYYAEGDVVVWIDGRVQVLSERFVPMVVEALGDADYAAWQHPTCRTMADQAVVCLRDMPGKYTEADLVGHYGDDAAEAGAGYDRVWQLTVMATRITYRTMRVGEDVLDAMAAHPRSIDQAEFPFAVRRRAAAVASLPGGQGGFWRHHSEGWFTLLPHRDGT